MNHQSLRARINSRARRFPAVALAGVALILVASAAFADPIRWTHRTGIGTGYRYGAGGIASDQAGDLIVTGRVSHNPQSGNPDYYFYAAKHAGTDGHLLWEYTAPSTVGPSNDFGGYVRIDSANNALVAGLHDSRIHIMKFSGSDGHLLWEGPAPDFFNTSGLVTMQIDGNNDLIVFGWTSPIGPPTINYYLSTAKYSGADGHLIWRQSHNAPSYPYHMAIDPNGRVIVAGQAQRNDYQGSGTRFDSFVTEYDAADGHIRWEYRYADSENGHARLVAADPNGDAFVFGMAGSDQWAAKLSAADGHSIWTERVRDVPRRELRDIAADQSGNVVIAGHDATGGDPWSFYVAKYGGATGSPLWEHRTSGDSDYFGGEAKEVKLDNDGRAYVLGSKWFRTTGGGIRYEVHGVVYAADGALLWEQRYVSPDGNPYISPTGEAFLPNNDLAVVGSEGDGSNLLLIKYSTASQLLNISTRARVQTGDDALIGGFIVTGASPKKVLLRAIGPSLPITGALQDPILELHLADGTTVSNDNWRDTQEAQIQATSIPPTNNQESAIVATIPPGAHSAVVRGKNAGTGVGLVEVYDIDSAAPATPANISTRGRVGIGDDVMIGGFILRGPRASTVLVRSIGPSLTSAGIQGALQNPTLELVDANGNSFSNDDWKRNAAGAIDPAQQSRIENTGLAPRDDRESALLVGLVPGAYTAIARGKNNSTGVGLIEAYNLE